MALSVVVGSAGLDDGGGDALGGEVIGVGGKDLNGELLDDLLERGAVDAHLGLEEDLGAVTSPSNEDELGTAGLAVSGGHTGVGIGALVLRELRLELLEATASLRTSNDLVVALVDKLGPAEDENDDKQARERHGRGQRFFFFLFSLGRRGGREREAVERERGEQRKDAPFGRFFFFFFSWGPREEKREREGVVWCATRTSWSQWRRSGRRCKSRGLRGQRRRPFRCLVGVGCVADTACAASLGVVLFPARARFSALLKTRRGVPLLLAIADFCGLPRAHWTRRLIFPGPLSGSS